jgi:membrane-bound metal-dependent hydrolase YbcI (DUF457 family)
MWWEGCSFAVLRLLLFCFSLCAQSYFSHRVIAYRRYVLRGHRGGKKNLVRQSCFFFFSMILFTSYKVYK